MGKDLLDELMKRVDKLARDKHGNYVVQCILKRGRKEDVKHTIEIIRKDLVDFAKNKVSSNVVERCFEVSTIGEYAEYLAQDREKLMHTILGDPEDSKSPLQQLMHDKFGNYTVQKVILYSRGDDREVLRQRIMAKEADLKNSATGKHILAALEKELKDD